MEEVKVVVIQFVRPAPGTYVMGCSTSSMVYVVWLDNLQLGLSVVKKIFPGKLANAVFSTIFLLVFGIVNVVSLVFDIYVIAGCPFEYCGYIYTPNNKSLYNLTNYTANASSFGAPPAESQLQYDDWQKAVFTTATISGLLSYYLMVTLVLCPLYGVCNPCCKRVCNCVASIWKRCGEREAQSSAIRETPLNHFVDSNEFKISTLLGPRQSFYFHLIFWANIILFAAGVVVFHWILYTLTAFMSISYFAEAIIEDLYGYTHKKCFSKHNTSCVLDLVYIGLFMLEHCVLFLYPCFWAASVSTIRSRLIEKVSRAQWNNIPLQEKESFCLYLKDQKCEFTISVLCAEIPFGYNLAFISIFFGVFGVILKLSF